MINKASAETNTINDTFKSQNIGRKSLQTWNKIALHASTLKEYMFEFTNTISEFSHVFFSVETCQVLQASAIYHSLYQRQDEALACQEQMLTIIAAMDISETDYKDLTSVKIPLLYKDRIIIQASVTAALGSRSSTSGENTQPLDSKTLRKKGNDFFKLGKCNDSIQCYCEAVSISNNRINPSLYSNRSLAYLKINDYENALRDAEECIQLDPTSWKAYCWKAYAVSNLIRLGHLSVSWESVGLAAAAVAGHLNERCLLEYKMKIEYPVVRFMIIDDERKLGQNITSLLIRPFTTLLLKKGRYTLSYEDITTKSIQIIGIDDEVEIHNPNVLNLTSPEKSWFRVDFKVESQINIHFENVFFSSGSEQVRVWKGIHATFYRCRFSNGKQGCRDFPYCEGGDGCKNYDSGECRLKTFERKTLFGSRHLVTGAVGNSGIAAVNEGNVFIENCIFDRCGGSGTLCDGEGSSVIIKIVLLKI
ncbi:uncharacterized protein LOC123544790 isoform X1 [Mercenaria mercenaria]|uniref:uncharacterized protein LOC123544790 isoform X1 n=1 Tax=Mercenaria mercenaria TaxID=6596 RepID=UPI00234ECED7|nr:uncharacterized protein LOC123544790 isoform X1 [Mercenaria mercenaria]